MDWVRCVSQFTTLTINEQVKSYSRKKKICRTYDLELQGSCVGIFYSEDVYVSGCFFFLRQSWLHIWNIGRGAAGPVRPLGPSVVSLFLCCYCGFCGPLWCRMATILHSRGNEGRTFTDSSTWEQLIDEHFFNSLPIITWGWAESVRFGVLSAAVTCHTLDATFVFCFFFRTCSRLF